MISNAFDYIDPAAEGAITQARCTFVTIIRDLADTYFRQKASDIVSGKAGVKAMSYVTGNAVSDWRVATHPTVNPVFSPHLMASVIVYGLAKESNLRERMLDGRGKLYPSVLLDSVFGSVPGDRRIGTLALARMKTLAYKAWEMAGDPERLVNAIDNTWFHGLIREWHTRGMKSLLRPAPEQGTMYTYNPRFGFGLLQSISLAVCLSMKCFLCPGMYDSNEHVELICKILDLVKEVDRHALKDVLTHAVNDIMHRISAHGTTVRLDSTAIDVWKAILCIGTGGEHISEPEAAPEPEPVAEAPVDEPADGSDLDDDSAKYNAAIHTALMWDDTDITAVTKLRDACNRRIAELAPKALARKREEYRKTLEKADTLKAEISLLESSVGKEVSGE